MVSYISRLKLRSFKSFKFADIQFGRGFVCLAGPNGSGKSNICDAIMFALGEMSLKSLRVKKVKDLIHRSFSKAEVTLEFLGDEKIEIKRGIREDGKVLYKLNGKRTTRSAIIDLLTSHGIAPLSHNLIAQGQIQHIVEMNSKERRQILDSVSGVMEFERKKEEALTELGHVESKINETKIVLAEREGVLSELEKEKNDALLYIDATNRLKNSKASLLCLELNKIEGEHSKILHDLEQIEASKKDAEAHIRQLDEKIKQLSEERGELINKINKRGEREGTIKEIEDFKSKIKAAEATINEKNRVLKGLEDELKKLDARKNEYSNKILHLETKIAASQQEAALNEIEINRLKESGLLSKRDIPQTNEAERVSTELSLHLQKRAKLEGEISSIQETLLLLEEKQKKLEVMVSEIGINEEKDLTSKKSALLSEIQSLEKEIDALFEKEKEINKEIPQLDKSRLELGEKAATLRTQVRGGGEQNHALAVVSQLKGKISGIYGTVSELISFDQEYAVAIEAACGQRLNYVVVENIDVASQIISILKKQKGGRCTFIPLDRKVTPLSQETEKIAKSQYSLGYLSEFVKYERYLEPVMNYVFSDTILVNSIEQAKKIGLQKARIVTIEGELIERSGVITGGSFSGIATARAQLEKIESEILKIKEKREALYSTLYSTREEMGRKRKEKAALEVELKGIEVKLDNLSVRIKSLHQSQKDLEQTKKRVQEILALIEQKKSQMLKLDEQMKVLESRLRSIKEKMVEEEKKTEELKIQEQNRLNELIANHSALLEGIKGFENELALYRSHLHEATEEEKRKRDDLKLQKSEIINLQKQCAEYKDFITAKEEELREASKRIQKWFETSKELETQISALAIEKGKFQHSSETASKKIEELKIKKAMIETKLIDLKSEFEEYKEFEKVDAPKEKLLELIRESEETLSRLGSVNLKAPHIYEEKRKDVLEIKEKLSKLSDERSAVLQMISEIEKRKYAVFMETFTAIADNFKRLYANMFKDEEAMLVLENPTDPFLGGLAIKVREGKHEKNIESMSGGEKSLMAIVFLFAIQLYRPAPFYVLDEVDAALDKENSKKLSILVSKMADKTQFIVVTHNDAMLTAADMAIGVSMTDEGSKVVGLQIKNSIKIKND
ncbi:MAG: chromosome segregation protein SMC [Candidatus Anstonellales archaeon]